MDNNQTDDYSDLAAAPDGDGEATTPSSTLDGFPSMDELAAVSTQLDDVESVLKSLDIDKGLESQCAALADQGLLDERPALAAYWRAKTEAATRQ